MFTFIGKVVVGFILVALALRFTTMGNWSLGMFLLPFVFGGD